MQNNLDQLQLKFIDAVTNNELPSGKQYRHGDWAGLSDDDLADIFDSQLMSRHLDLQSRRMQRQGNSFYTIGSAGHEGNAASAVAFHRDDMAFLHYRSGAFMIQRSKQHQQQDILRDMLLSFTASSDDPIAGGRHKVLGSKSLFIPPQTSTIASHLPKAMGAAYSIGLANRLQQRKRLAADSVIVCSFGDASANHSTAQGAINAAIWAAYQSVPMPIVFICEDNGLGISTPTPPGWIETLFAQRPGLRYLRCDGLDMVNTFKVTRQAAEYARQQQKPVFLHMRTVRLYGHAGSDAEIAYRYEQDILATEAQDPLLHSARILISSGLMSPQQICQRYLAMAEQVQQMAQQVILRPKLENAEAIKASLIPAKVAEEKLPPVAAYSRQELFAHDKHNLGKPQHMAKLLNWAMLDLMSAHQEIIMCGEDIARKGGVYNVTSRLHEKFGSLRVTNTLLDEQSILGLAIGLAHNGFLPIPEIQFLAYVHNAEDQIRGEAATLSFFSNGQFTNPMVIRIPGLAYQRGFGGHFHNDNSLAVFRDIPGLMIACPSNGADAVEMMRAAVRLAREQQRIVIFIEPIALYMKKDLHTEGDNLWLAHYQPPQPDTELMPGQLGCYGDGKDLCIISYGNGYYLSRQAELLLKQKQIKVTLIDLRWLAPLDHQALHGLTCEFDKLLIVDECRQTGSISEALTTSLLEHRQANQLPVPEIGRITAQDCFIPLGEASYKVLPGVEDIVNRVMAMCNKAGKAND